ncbi:hypothetical protein GQ53DRAFT_755835 [Thozetella sp. PMI_491]|nr:hypothetical protein GQ53DRAFT_755835 [Thozetella sp. PMI_491]
MAEDAPLKTPDLDAVDPFSPDFDNILNFRDVGETINEFLGKKFVREGLVFRSARPDDASLEDRRRLEQEFHIRTVMDLRTKTEHINAAKKRKRELAALGPAALAKSNEAFAEPPQIPGLKYLEIKLTGRKFERYLLSQLGWWSFIKFIILFLCGFRMKAIAILGREVMQPIGLPGLGTSTLDQSGSEINEALSSFLEPSALPMLVHCTQGKDRTGIIILLALMILGVPMKAIDFDYQLSNDALLAEKEYRLAEIREIGLTEDFAGTAEDFVEKTAAHLESRYGGLNAYLDSIGFDEDRRRKLVEILAY